jgi:hypothetical protein
LPFGTVADRVAALAGAARAVGETGLPVWIGGNSLVVRETVALGGAWNAWGPTPEVFAREAQLVHAVAPGAAITWGGLVVLGTSDDAARDKAARLHARPGTLVGAPPTVAAALRAYVDVGASWIVLGPIDSSDPTNAALIAEVRLQLA